MKIVFVSNYFNHHQSELSEELYRITNGNYYFIQTEPMSDERKRLGWSDTELPDYVMSSYSDKNVLSKCLDMIIDADVVIAGSAPNLFLRQRLKQKKLVFRYSERIYKNYKNIITLPLRFIKYHTYNHGSKNVYLLCASAYAASDYAKTFNYIATGFKWGYFPATKYYEDINEILKLKRPFSILWVARFIKWKHPEIPVKIAAKLKAEGYVFELNMVGDGHYKGEIAKIIKKHNLDDCVHLLGSMSPDEVRARMEVSEMFLLTSDRNEGWGAVLNEAMNSACAVVANSAIGSVPYLLHDGENGFIYKNGRTNDLYHKVKILLDDSEKRKSMGCEAYKTMIETWNARVAAARLVKLTDCLTTLKTVPFTDGPCSKA